MRTDRPSRTAHLVALGRAVADAGLSHVPGFEDPTARHFLNARGKESLAKLERAAGQPKPGMRVEMARGMGDLMALRTSAMDAAVRDAIGEGVRQLVILGAGYDGRAWRMPELAGVSVFEVDRPGTQADKRTHLSELPPAIGEVSFVAADLERESLDAVLARGGHDPLLPTCWVWEGVIMYLTGEAVGTTLRVLAGRSAPGSVLIVNYHTRHKGVFSRLLLRLIGEPQISFWSPEAMAVDLRAAGFVVRADSGMADWNARFAEGRARVARASFMRIAVAENASRIGA